MSSDLEVLCIVAAAALREMAEPRPPQSPLQASRRVSTCGPDSPDHVLVYDVEAGRYVEEPRSAQSQRQPQRQEAPRQREEVSSQREQQQQQEQQRPQQEPQPQKEQSQQQPRTPAVIILGSPESSPEVVCVGYYRSQSAKTVRRLF